MLPNDLPPWKVVYQQTQRWIKAGCFEALAHDLRAILRLALERKADPSAVILDSRTVQSTPESGARAGFDGHKKRKGSKVHIAVDTLGHLLALAVTPANEQDRAQGGQLAEAVQAEVEEPQRFRKVGRSCRLDRSLLFFAGRSPACWVSGLLTLRESNAFRLTFNEP
jgi:transposase